MSIPNHSYLFKLSHKALEKFPTKFHPLVTDIGKPERFNNPFRYVPHPSAAEAVKEMRRYIESETDLSDELAQGKMLGVLVAETDCGTIGYLAAYSGLLKGRNELDFFVPAVYDMLEPEGWFKVHEREISQINSRIAELLTSGEFNDAKAELDTCRRAAEDEITSYKKAMEEAKRKREAMRCEMAERLADSDAEELIRESQFMKAELRRIKKRHEAVIAAAEERMRIFEATLEELKKERQIKSESLQKWLFSQFRMLNAKGETKDLNEIFSEYADAQKSNSPLKRVPPGGSGECCAPKLLQYAYLHNLKPLCIAEFWWGRSPAGEIRRHLQYYPACQGKCKPILSFMLQGLQMESEDTENRSQSRIEILFEDEYIAVANKPAKMLSVPGKTSSESVYSIAKQMFPSADGPLIAHRLDQDTSGLLLLAKTKKAHAILQRQFEDRKVKKKYIALVQLSVGGSSGTVEYKVLNAGETGRIELPLAPDYLDRPRQKVDRTNGKTAITEYSVLSVENGIARIELSPLTGRTHQLRIHCAHEEGLGAAIVGDPLYGDKPSGLKEGEKSGRMYLHACEIIFRHPETNRVLTFRKDPGF